MLFAIVDYGWIMFAQMNVQQAVDDAGRYASTGQESSAGSRISSIINVIQTTFPGSGQLVTTSERTTGR